MIEDGINSTKRIDSFLMIGQSNMAGRGDLSDVEPIKNPQCYMLRMGRWQPMSEPVNPDRSMFVGKYKSGISLAASFADEYSKCFGKEVGLIPCADGGTTLSQWKKGGLLFDHAVMMTRLALRTSNLQGIIWHQGESDLSNENVFDYYEDEFVKFVCEFRETIGKPSIPFIAGELPHSIGQKWHTEGREVEFNLRLKCLEDVIPNFKVVSSEKLIIKEDGIHFNSESLREFGKRYFFKFRQF